ncbi:MAG: PilZ domain-containing protein [Spirochaetales bacterium]|nr:PilZ domain-containing protein [Spirochaetales bacterium]
MIENRDYKRAQLLAEIDYYSDIKARAKNISESGICMITQTVLTKGMPLILKFNLSSKGSINLIGKVVRCHSIKPDVYECGLKFTSISIMDQQKIREYVYEQIKGKTDRRDDFRTEINISINYASPISSIVKDYNAKGMCIITEQKFKKESMILLILTLPENEKLHVYGKVIWCHEIKPGIFKTGIKFCNIDNETKSRILVFFKDYSENKLKSK